MRGPVGPNTDIFPEHLSVLSGYILFVQELQEATLTPAPGYLPVCQSRLLPPNKNRRRSSDRIEAAAAAT